ncbi:DUF2141 domain-containing protein [Sphingoaurantiacus capsulatus]|uniref:DUF2141 domain-containing protein n=1 Tax=Sphingoaurantiacus capsulatus TaxID=1771310 RepID=A0ABV7XB84_9SPHN
MKKSLGRSALTLAAATFTLAAASAATPAHAQEILGPDAAACRAGTTGPSALVRIYGFKDRGGNLRVQLYGNNPDQFLAKGNWLKRIELPIVADGDMNVCVELPSYGDYAIAVRHDRDANGKSGWNDGGGFSGNPKLSLGNLKPDYEDTSFAAGQGVVVVDVIMNYRNGLSIKPVVAKRD